MSTSKFIIPSTTTENRSFIDKDGAVMSPLILSHSISDDTPNSHNQNDVNRTTAPQSSNRLSNPLPTKRVVSFATQQQHNVHKDAAFDPFHSFSGSGSFESRNTSIKISFSDQLNVHNYTKQPINVNSPIMKKPVVPSSGYGKSGQINFRADNLAMICKKWTEKGYWLHVYPATINLFNNIDDMEHWKQLNDSFDKNSEGLDSKMKRQMNQLVKKSINFDTTGELKKKMLKIEEKNARLSTTKNKSVSRKKVGDNNRSTLPKTYIMEEVRSKHYQQNDPLMHTCKISYLGLSGRHVSAAFGSTIPQELKRIRAVIRDIIKLVKKAKKNKSKKFIQSDYANDAWKISTARSEMTTVSNTVYGKNTTFDQRRTVRQ